MPSVGSTPTLTSPQQIQQQSMLQHAKLQLQHSLPLQLQLQLHKHQQQQQQQHQQQHQQHVTTTQPSPAGTYPNKCIATHTDTLIHDDNDADDSSPMSSPNSFSSVDTNQTLLNSIATQTQQLSSSNVNNSANRSAGQNASRTNRSYRTKYSQFMIITPAVSIDRNFDNATGAAADAIVADDESYFDNGNIFRMTLLQSSIDSGNSSDSSFRSNYNPNIHSSRHHLLSKAPTTFYTFSSWRWCTLICAAMRCFGAGHHNHSSSSAAASFSTSFSRPPYRRSRSSGIPSSVTPHRRLRSSSTSAEPYAAFTPRKTRDHMNNITYEL